MTIYDHCYLGCIFSQQNTFSNDKSVAATLAVTRINLHSCYHNENDNNDDNNDHGDYDDHDDVDEDDDHMEFLLVC